MLKTLTIGLFMPESIRFLVDIWSCVVLFWQVQLLSIKCRDTSCRQTTKWTDRGWITSLDGDWLIDCRDTRRCSGHGVRHVHQDLVQMSPPLRTSSDWWGDALHWRDSQLNQHHYLWPPATAGHWLISLTPVLALWRQLLPRGYSYKHPVPVICNFLHLGLGTLMLRAERQSAQMSKITNDGLTR